MSQLMIALLSSTNLNPLCLAFPIPMNLMRPGALGYTLIIICLWPPKVAAAIVNATIDDQRGDSVTGSQVTYYPPDVWNDQTCGKKCTIGLDTSQAINGTYTAGTYDPAEQASIGINMEFTGRIYKLIFVVSII